MDSSPRSAKDRGGANRRDAKRFPSAIEGLLIYGDLSFRIRCTISDISATGARLDVRVGVGLQDVCYLYLAKKNLIARVNVMWRGTREKGVKFLEPWSEPGQHPEERIRALKLG